ncbi:MAG: hypothetical protein R3D27_02420 [Hyphomicrobiaceae bacterium]
MSLTERCPFRRLARLTRGVKEAFDPFAIIDPGRIYRAARAGMPALRPTTLHLPATFHADSFAL